MQWENWYMFCKQAQEVPIQYRMKIPKSVIFDIQRRCWRRIWKFSIDGSDWSCEKFAFSDVTYVVHSDQCSFPGLQILQGIHYRLFQLWELRALIFLNYCVDGKLYLYSTFGFGNEWQEFVWKMKYSPAEMIEQRLTLSLSTAYNYPLCFRSLLFLVQIWAWWFFDESKIPFSQRPSFEFRKYWQLSFESDPFLLVVRAKNISKDLILLWPACLMKRANIFGIHIFEQFLW